MNPTLYTTPSNILRVDPANPGVYPTVLDNYTTVDFEQLQQHHDEACRIYDNSGKMNEVLTIKSLTPTKIPTSRN